MTATPRSRRLRTLAAALVTTAALSLTACQTGTADATGVVDSTQPPAPGTESTEKQSPATGTDSDTAGASNDSGDSKGSDSSGNSVNSGSSGKEATQVADRKTAKKTTSCTAKGTKVTVTDAPRPINHLLIKATNTSDTTCHLYYAPYLRFDQAQSAVPFIEESKPQAVVTLEPGESGYAGVLTSTPDGSHPYDATSLTLYYAARSGQGSTGAPSHPALPFDSVRIDSSNAVTYWQTSAADALMW
ncbi:DUF4232 domain-containing protein [Streptomyces albidoflavus]|uniref:DUF4232 domain-containing protein n=1 Tax=Streptomyces albidoflavus TaxID=1886 RepID=A0A126Y5D2_9ACTN|nr:DUF4232 domain-containing protein [Streptomyces albidoflavus]AMM10200.1 hypothetical protein Salbus254_3732 [Streptomyces albidoflavus]KUL62854.1 hypothetical protein ADL32_11230 [Streptomyces albidoflavus]MCX4442185.1 DUF4232 domain-containing protein [Streptomyces albidoflavus]RZE20706.1 DUF4232 domain-containing protein [Streptomyces albidoflavus]RZE41984.1 DUF4232 domain-containing protein [Streptomyces albidoflavus]